MLQGWPFLPFFFAFSSFFFAFTCFLVLYYCFFCLVFGSLLLLLLLLLFVICISFWRIPRSSHQRCSVRKSVLRNFTKFTGKHLCQSLFFNKVKKEMLAQVFSCDFCEISNNTFFTEHLWKAASEYPYFSLFCSLFFWKWLVIVFWCVNIVYSIS